MLAAMLVFGSVWSSFTPFAVQPGMSQQQVEAVLGEKPTGFLRIGGKPRGYIKNCFYAASGLSVTYGSDGKVSSVRHN